MSGGLQPRHYLGAPAAAPVRLSWARLLKRVFEIDIEQCPQCDGTLTILAAIEDPPVIPQIFSHLGFVRPGTAPIKLGRAVAGADDRDISHRSAGEPRYHEQCRGAGAPEWARLLKRLFEIDIEQCPQCGGTLTILAAIEDPPVIAQIFSHLGLSARAPPRSSSGIWALAGADDRDISHRSAGEPRYHEPSR